MPARLPFGFVAAAVVAFSILPGQGSAASLEPSQWRGDARFLVAAVDSIHPAPYRWQRRAAWDSAAADLESRLPSMRFDQAVAGFSGLLALLHDGHSRLDQLSLPLHGRPALGALSGTGFDVTYPFDADVFADGLWITRTTAAQSDLLGAHVVAVNQTAMSDVAAAFTPIIPADNSMWTLYMLPSFLRSPGYVSAAGLARDPAAPLELTVVDAKGRRREVSLRAQKADSTARWVAADDRVPAALPLTRALPYPFAFADLGDSEHSVFVRIRAIVNDPGAERMSQFVARLFAHADSIGCRRLILDLRGNGGGNNYLNQPLVHAIIRHPELDQTGRLFAIVDRGTFSAAVSLSSDLQRETQALFVGEPTGAAPNSPGDPAHVTLPGSGLVVRISTIMWYGSDPRDPREFIAPDLPAMPSWADWMAHRDPALSAIAAYRVPAGFQDLPPNQHWGDPARLKAQLPTIAW